MQQIERAAKMKEIFMQLQTYAKFKFKDNIILSLLGARVCYSAKPLEELLDEFRNDNKEYLYNLALRLTNHKHYSVFAHSFAYFDLYNIKNLIPEDFTEIALNKFKVIYDVSINPYKIGLTLRHFLEEYDKYDIKEEFIKSVIELADFDKQRKELILKENDNVILVACNKEYKGYATFYITCSRACSHQIVRHTIFNFSQKSQRYVLEQRRKSENIVLNDYIPPKILNNIDAYKDYIAALEYINKLYKKFITEYNIPAEDARYLLTNSKLTNLVMSGTIEQFKDFISKRVTNEAQYEIRQVAKSMQQLLEQS